MKTNNYAQKKLHPIGNAPEIILLVTIRVCEFVIVIAPIPERHVTIASRIGEKTERADTLEIPASG